MKSIKEKAKRLYEKGTITESLCHIFPELKESEDERIRKGIIDFLWKEKIFLQEAHSSVENNPKYRFVMDAIAWLEKQRERKEATCVAEIIDHLTEKEQEILFKELEMQKEQKPADKPKFHEGDWISGYYTNYRVTAINSKGYVVEDTDGNKINILFENEKFHHLFTIADAKDGDVLVDVYGNIGIYQKNDDFDWKSYWSLGCYGGFQPFIVEHEIEGTCPATKEQRDTLERAMTNAGWEFDFEKKEFKKLSQQEVTKISDQEKDSAWNEEDEINFKEL